MKSYSMLMFVFLLVVSIGCTSETQTTGNSEPPLSTEQTTNVVNQIVEASCGACKFDMEGAGCDLAVRIDGKSYYVDGSSMGDHGDAHGDAGMCNCIRQAKVTGEINDGRFVATSFEVLPQEKNEGDAKGDHGSSRDEK